MIAAVVGAHWTIASERNQLLHTLVICDTTPTEMVHNHMHEWAV
jgi:hypothetical protein